MKKILILLFFINLLNSMIENKKTCMVPLSDAYPLRYFYHTPFYYDRFDVGNQWLCKGNCMIRYQQAIDKAMMTSLLFDNPLLVSSNGLLFTGTQDLAVYNGTVLGLGFLDMISQNNITLHRNSFFIDCTVEISRINSPYYVHIGVPVQRTQHTVDWCEAIFHNDQVIKGGFMQEYQPTSAVPSLDVWQNTPSTIIQPLKSMLEYLQGKGIGSLLPTQLGQIPPCSMTLWGIADLYLQVGYDGLCGKNFTGGYYGRIIVPTSPSLHSAWNRYLFYPTIGNVSRWEFDLGLQGRLTLFNSDLSGLVLYADGYIGYLGSACHMRPFDLKNGFFTRYAPVKMFDAETLLSKNGSIRTIDLTTQSYPIGTCVKAELIIDLEYQRCQSFWNIGYSCKLQGKESANCQERKINPAWSLQQNRIAYGFSPQQVLQTPNPLPYGENWITSLITPHSDMKQVAVSDLSEYQNSGQKITGVFLDESNQLTKNDINVNSGLMNSQFLNILVAGYSYRIIGRQYDTFFGIKGSYAVSPIKYYTPSFYELGIFLELDY